MKEQCENCRFWKRPEAQAEKDAGNCRRYAPRPWGSGYVGVSVPIVWHSLSPRTDQFEESFSGIAVRYYVGQIAPNRCLFRFV